MSAQAESTLTELENTNGEIPPELITAAIGLLPQILALIKTGSKAKRLDGHDRIIQVLIQSKANTDILIKSMDSRLKALESR